MVRNRCYCSQPMPDGMRHRSCGQVVISNESLHGNRKNLEEGKMLKDRIKELREKNNLTISAFARSLNISPTSVSLYESGKQNPGKKTIANIRKVYGVDEAWLTERTTGAETIADTAQADENKTGHRIDKAAVLARAEEAGVRKAAAEFGVTWQTVNKWKKDAEKAAAAALDKVLALMQSPKSPEALMPTPGELDKMFEETFKEKMEEMDAAAEIEASAAEEKTEEKTEEKPAPPAIIIQSPMGGNITPEEIQSRIPPEANTVYVRVDENKLYWVNETESGHTDIW